MSKLLEIEPGPNGLTESWRIYQKYIGDGDVAVPGPSQSLFIDPILAIVAIQKINYDGELYVIDPKCDRFPASNIHPNIEYRVTGAGNVSSYLRELKTLQNLGVVLKEPIHTERAQALNFCLPKGNKLMTICDHDLSPFLVTCGWLEERDENIIKYEYLRIYRYFRSQLEKGGRLILQTDNRLRHLKSTDGDMGLSMCEMLTEAGFGKIEYLKVNDVFQFEIARAAFVGFDDKLFGAWKHESGYRYDYDYAGENVIIKIPLSGHHAGVRHPSPDMYIATV